VNASNHNHNYSRASVLIVGAGPAGLAAAITLKSRKPDLDVCVLDKAAKPGNHNLSGAVLEVDSLQQLLDAVQPEWRESDQAKEVLSRKVEQENVLFLPNKSMTLSMMPAIKIAKLLGLGFGQMIHRGDYIVSVSKLTNWLARIASSLKVEVLHGFAAEDIVMADGDSLAVGVKMKDQGLDKEVQPQINFVPGETISADVIILAEGCDGLVTESFVRRAGLTRLSPKQISVGIKELIQVSDKQYRQFGDQRVVHAMGFPIWSPLIGPNMFGGGFMYSFGDNQIAVGMIVGADWKYCDFNPEEALYRFKEHRFVNQFIAGGKLMEAGAKTIPEGGYYAIPRDAHNHTIGRNNVLIIGDSAGFVNMLKIKGLHNAIASGIAAGQAVAQSIENPAECAARYTSILEASSVNREMYSARNFRQTVAKLGTTAGLPLSCLGGLLPRFTVEKDYQAMTTARYKYRYDEPFEKDILTAMAHVEHREEQPCHCEVLDPSICQNECRNTYGDLCNGYGRPCIVFCPAGVYELIHDEMKSANPSNCVHCKTCQNKCPYDNLRWHAPEGGGGPHYKNM